MTPEVLAALVLALMTSLVPESEHAWKREAPAATHARYVELAEVIADVALDEGEEPVALEGIEPTLLRVRTAYLLATVAARESYFRREIMTCERAGLGNAWGTYQLQGGRRLVCGSLDEATRVALTMLRDAFRRCSALPVLDRASDYTDGRCIERWSRSRVRVAPALR